MACEKEAYQLQREALDVLRKLKRWQGGHGRRYLQVYLCGECFRWHVGRAWRGRREANPAVKPAPLPTTKLLHEAKALIKALKRVRSEWLKRQARLERAKERASAALAREKLAMETTTEELRELQADVLRLLGIEGVTGPRNIEAKQ